jgi:hypothetical protein
MGDPALLTTFSRAAAEHGDRDLNADVWHNHLLDQLVNLARGEPVHMLPSPVTPAPALEGEAAG